ncbi:NAD(P)H-binding protein [Paractinoplanes ferrugineus]|uniref:NmrA family transcriptional regulator n=1 Tax=Paractinoplanes ferrugineus TaxID=113564 RepID=A0A919JA67_9ACTN|nr:NAD(P)H-binding protein [Actinoplanes ferrugineus]GIE13431.1 NmrA family transcriptional regulator [Actinoplanes ferrugineus]
MIVVTGATGNLGGQIVDLLPAADLGVSVREPAKAAHLAARGMRVRRGDFTDPASLTSAFEGADQVLIVSASIRDSDTAIAANRAAIDAARTVGVKRIVYTGHQAAAHRSLFAPMPVHAATEDYLAESGVPYTVLRNGFYVTTLAFYLPQALATGVLALPADGPVSWTAHADLAEAAVAALTSADLLDGVTPPLTGPAAVDLAEVAQILTDVTGREFTRVVVDDDEWRATAGGFADFTLGMFRAARAGEFAVTDPILAKAIGRPATPVREFVERFVAAAQPE